METIQNVGIGFATALTWANITYCFLGVLVGTLIGVLPGIGPTATISLLLPATYYLGPTSAIIMLSGVYYGAMYGGSTTSILVNIPGETASIVTCLDGYQMALQGRAGPALGIAAFGSFIAGTLSVVGLMIAAPPLAKLGLRFGFPEFFSLIFLAFSLLIYLASGSILKAVIITAVGIFVGTIGIDFITGDPRFTYGSFTLSDGVGLVPVAMGLFGIAEVLENIEKESQQAEILKTSMKGLLPNLQDWKDSLLPIFRGTLIGFLLGTIPGGGNVMTTFTSYAVEKKISKHPERFGKGAIEGVASPEAANNASVAAHYIPLLTFGIPTTVVMAIILGALMIHGISPGPTFIRDNPHLFWGLIASMYLGNVMLLVLNLPLIGLWVRILSIPYRILFPLVLLFCLVGVYSLNYNFWEIIIMVIFGFVGYLMRKFKYEPAPFVFALLLGPMMENALRQSLLMSKGSFLIFFTRPIAAVGMSITLLMLIGAILPAIRRRKEALPIEEEI
jgi:putative tricarboxylic transport membrane protein